YLPDQIKAVVADRPKVILQHEAEVLGTGGGLRKALEHFHDDPVLVMNGDIFHDIDLSRLVTAHTAGNNAVTLALHDYPRFNSVVVQQGRVRDFSTSREHENLLAFTGIHVVNQEVLQQIPLNCFFHIIDLYKEIAEAGKIGYIRTDGSFWQDMGTPDDYLDLHRHLLSAQKPSWCIHESVLIGKNVQFTEWGAVGPGAVIGDEAQLARCVVWEGAEITAGAKYKDAILSD
ncbi:MAG: hypothetical protein D3904_08785, partial [Candidatus Electrothrix sp. EH2]|nr:hypothetical protein [Candidatus Electrothrix sp. EH2]